MLLRDLGATPNLVDLAHAVGANERRLTDVRAQYLDGSTPMQERKQRVDAFQASDCAHRIGQTRPVTIYRLVAQDTIEEKIVDLHTTKRALADSLLEGSDLTAKMTAVDMLALLHEEWGA